MHRRRFLASVPLFLWGAGCLGKESCPPFEIGADRSVCSRTRSDEPIWLSVAYSAWDILKGDNTVDTNVFTLHNESGASIRFNPHEWKLYEKRKESWTMIKRGNGDDGSVVLKSGEVYRWSLSRVNHPTPNAAHTGYITADISTGQYGFVVRVSDPHNDESIACLAVFSVAVAVRNSF
jgi:hypothetical protein